MRGRGGLGRGRLGRPSPLISKQDSSPSPPSSPETVRDENNNVPRSSPIKRPTRGLMRGGLRRGRGSLTQQSPAVEPSPVHSPSTPTRGGLLRRGRGGLGRGSLSSRPVPTSSPKQVTAAVVSESLKKLELTDEIGPDDSASQIGTTDTEAAPGRRRQLRQTTTTTSAPTTDNEKVSDARRETTDYTQTSAGETEASELYEKPRDKVNRFGKSGTAVQLATNFVKLTTKEGANTKVFQYSVKFSPTADSKKLCGYLIYQHENIFPKDVGKIFDGRGILYCAKDIFDVGSKKGTEKVLESKSKEGTVYKVIIKLAKVIDVDSSKMVPIYNTILSRIQKEMKLIPIRDSYYSMNREKKIKQYGISVWPGYTATVQQQTGGLMLMVDLSFKVLRNQKVLEIFAEQRKASGGDWKTNCLRALVGQSIITRYNNKNYRIDDIDFETNPASTFNRNGKEISFTEYFKEQYGLTIKDQKQPLLVNRPKKKTVRNARDGDGKPEVIYLVPELCNATGLTDKMRCDFKVMQELAKITRVKPDVRNAELQGFVDDIHKMDFAQNEFAKWGLVLDTNPATVHGRNIHKETLLIGGNLKKPVNANADFGAVVTKSPMLDPITLQDWVIFHEAKDEKKVTAFIDCYRKCVRQLAQTVEKPTAVVVKGKNADQIRAMSEYLKNKPKTQLVVNFMSSKREDRYNATKVLCCVENPVPSQVICVRTLPDDPKQGKFASVTQKIALQINAKLGGSLWAVQIPITHMMLVGIDVWHGATKTSKRASVVGMVSSYDARYTKWYSRAFFQDSADHEVSSKLTDSFIDSLKNFRYHNNCLPKLIVVYRDGVSDGALQDFKDTEMMAFNRAVQRYDESYKPKIAVVIVSKRINTRMYALQGRKLDNPMPGTIMDQQVTKPYYQDFYLVSQYVRQGTVTPSHFICLEDGELSPDHLQKLSYKLTHMYYNWPGTVRVPAPCQYAHKLAALVGENIQQEPNEKLSDKLYYL